MKIYNRTDFLKLPAGVLFCEGKRWYFEGMAVKGTTIGDNDFGELHLGDIDSEDSGQLSDRFEDMAQNNASYPLSDSYGRNGLFDAKSLFLVFEADDLDALSKIIAEAKQVATS